MDKITKTIDPICYKLLVQFLGVIALLCYLTWWIPLLWSIGAFIRLDFKEGILAFLVFLLFAITTRGGGILIEKLKSIDNDIFD